MPTQIAQCAARSASPSFRCAWCARPSASKIEMLRKIAGAGGTRMTEALLDRVDPETRPRVRHLLETLGLEPAGAQS